MAYTQAPENQTYGTQSIPAVYDLDIPTGVVSGAINSTNGAGMRNVIPVKHGEEALHGETRPSIGATAIPTTNAAVCRGAFAWEKTAGTVYYFTVISDTVALTSKVYTSTNATSWTAVTTLTNYDTSPVRFAEFIDATNVKKLVLVDGIEGYVFTTNAAGTKIVDADFPTPHVPFPVFVDGYLFLAKASTGDIYNSDLNDPAVWTAGSFISSELYPDDVQALVKVNNYILAIGTQGCEYFYDAANPTASPLARVEGSSLPFGTGFPNTIASNKDTVFLLANTNDGQVALKKIVDFKSTDIKCPFIPLLNDVISSGGTAAAKLRGSVLKQNDSLCYLFSFNGVNGTSSTPTFLYTTDFSMWVEYTYTTAAAALQCFPVYYTSPPTTSSLLTFIAGHTEAGLVFFGSLYPSFYSGPNQSGDSIGGTGPGQTVITQQIRTPYNNFGTLNLKTQSRFGLLFTSPNYTSSTVEDFIISWEDTGRYVDFTTNMRTLKKSFTFPFIVQLGSFRQRAFSIASTSIYPIRYIGIEVDINKGQQ
jgi:hypothetical protein